MSQTVNSHVHRGVFHRAAVAGGAIAATLALVSLGTGCDATATIFKLNIELSSVQPLGAWPAQENADGTWDRVCNPGTEVDGVITDIALISSTRQSSTTTDRERDLQIQPGDVVSFLRVDGPSVDDIKLSGTTNIEVDFSCIDPAGGDSDCSATDPSTATDRVTYQANVLDRDAGHNVIFLIDQSGSISGLVRASDNKESSNPGQIPDNFGLLASDRNNLRLSAVKNFLSFLDDEDRFAAIGFSEQSQLTVPCVDATGDFATDLDTCFRARNNRDIWTNPDEGVDSLVGTTGGRSNLWQAAEEAYDFLEALQDRQRSNHVIVITDGPDTCSRSLNLNGCEGACSGATTYETLLDKVETDAADPNGVRIQFHFVQFESLGYPGRDPRQWELACLSGGHYQFINTNQFPSSQDIPKQQAFDLSVSNLRFSLQGHWQVASDVQAFVDNNTGSGTPPGALYALAGTLTVKTAANLQATERVVPFSFGLGESANAATTWDRRLTIRKPCVAATDCGAAPGAGAACTVICSDETHTCPGGASGVELPDTAACTLDTGAGGFCCEGGCQPVGGVCAACTAN